MLDELVVDLIILLGFLIILCVGALVADYILPHIGPLNRWLETLPLWDEEEEEVTRCSSSSTRPRGNRCDTSTRRDCKRQSERPGRSRKQPGKRQSGRG